MTYIKIMKKYLILFFLVLIPLELISNFDYNNCLEEKIFYVDDVNFKDIKLSSFYCEFWKLQDRKILKNEQIKKWTFVYFDNQENLFRNIWKNELKDYFKRLKTDLDNIKNDEITKDIISKEYIKNFRDHKDSFSLFFKKYIFSKKELLKISVAIEKEPYKIFENTYSKRLLMNWEIISREQWWAIENYSNPEIYMKWCEDGKCFSWPIAKNELKENYLKYFNDLDKKDKITKSFNDWRDDLKYYPVDRIIIHHTAGWYQATKEDWMKYMKAVQKYHALNLRWWDVGYHYLIDWEGNIYEWKSGWKYVLWSHVATHNYWSIGISLMSDWYYSQEMMLSLQKLVVYLWDEYNLDLTKKTQVRNNDLTWFWTWWALIAHKELDSRKPKDPEINMEIFREKIVDSIINNKKLTKK